MLLIVQSNQSFALLNTSDWYFQNGISRASVCIKSVLMLTLFSVHSHQQFWSALFVSALFGCQSLSELLCRLNKQTLVLLKWRVPVLLWFKPKRVRARFHTNKRKKQQHIIGKCLETKVFSEEGKPLTNRQYINKKQSASSSLLRNCNNGASWFSFIS